MKKIFIILTIIGLALRSYSQDIVITPQMVDNLKSEAKKWVEIYNNNLNNLGSKKLNPMDKTMLIESVLKQFDADDAVVANDLDLSGKTPKEFKIKQHLGNITTWFASKGIDFQFSNFQISDVFIDKKAKNLFVKIGVDRDINGTNMSDLVVTGKYKLDFYIKFKYTESQISAKPEIFSIDEHRDNLASFTKTTVQEKLPNNLEISKDRKEVDDITKAADEKEKELKKKEAEADSIKGRADQAFKDVDAKFREMKISMYGKHFTLNFFPLRIAEGVYQAGISACILRTKSVTLALDLSAGTQTNAVSRLITFNDSIRNDSLYDKMHYFSKASGSVFRGEFHIHFKEKKWYLGYLFNSESVTYETNSYHLGNATLYNVSRNATGHYLMYGSRGKRFDFYVAIGMKSFTYTNALDNGPKEITKSNQLGVLIGSKLKFNL